MKIQSIQKLNPSTTAVFTLKNQKKIDEHPFFKFFAKEDQNYLNSLKRELAIQEEYSQLIFLPSGKRVIIFKIKDGGKPNLRKSILLMRRVVNLAKKEKIKELTVRLEDFNAPVKDSGFLKAEGLVEILATQLELANFEFTRYKTPPKDGWNLIEKVFVLAQMNPTLLTTALRQGQIIGEEINKARILANTPGGDMTPRKLAEAAVKSAKEAGYRVKIFNEKKIRQLKMGGVLGVSKGSNEKPRFIVMEYLKGRRNEKAVVLVGKGVTFDTGGLNLKPAESISEMQMDMSGGAAVIHIIAALARLKAKKNVIGLVPAVENMPSGSSYHPGDVLKTMSGKTVEVLNTDAEGRIILADALEYAKKYKPRLVIDIATLTGAAVAALGQRASAIFTTDSELEKSLRETGEKTGDYVWPLPLWEEYEEEIKGTFGDVANISKTRYGGAITGTAFLWQFIKDPSASSGQAFPWVHLDIAPRMTSIESDFLAKGAAGASVGLLTNFLRGS